MDSGRVLDLHFIFGVHARVTTLADDWASLWNEE